MYLPPELIREIIAFILDGPLNNSEEPGISTKQSWSSLEPLTLASKAYRTLSLVAWFRILFIKDPKDIPILYTFFPEIGTAWTR